MKVLVAGAHGKTARPLVRILTEDGHEVRGLVRKEEQMPDVEADDAEATENASCQSPGINPVDLRIRGLGASCVCARWAQEGLQTRLGQFGRFESCHQSGVEVCEAEAGEARAVEEDVHGRDPPVLQRGGADRVDVSVEQ